MRRNLAALLSLLLVGLAPLVSDAGAGQARCCNLASSFTQNLFPGGSGDEDFFTVPGGPPNVMVLLDTSLSMLNFPRPLAFPEGLSNSQGTCAVAAYEDAAAARLVGGQFTYESAFNYSTQNNPANGNSNSPQWVTGNCGGTGGNAKECLFDPAKFYHYTNPPESVGGVPYAGSGSLSDVPWTETAGRPSGTTAASACTGLSGAAQTACTECLSGLNAKGYYLYKDSSGTRQAAFAGSFLNVYPPKFMIARKVLKDILSINPGAPAATDGVRFGLTRFQSGGGQMVKPLAPSCGDAVAATAATNFVAARKDLIDAVDQVQFRDFTPLAESLFSIGQYFSDGATSNGTGSQWAAWFPGTWKSAFWNGTGSTNSNPTSSICWSCQQSSVVIITDGAPFDDNNGLPDATCGSDHTSLFGCPSASRGDFRRWVGGTVDPSKKLPIDCPLCGTDGNNGSKNLLHLVAAFMRYNDLRKDPPANGTDTTQRAGNQTVATYTIGVNLQEGSTAAILLQKTADLGGGTFVNSSNPAELESALFNAVTDVINKATSFSVSNTNTLQASTAAQLFTARFRPLDKLSWEGHLYRFTLFNELALGCDPTKTNAQQTLVPTGAGACVGKNPNLDGKTTNGLADCSDFYIVDADCDPVIEDSVSGFFLKATFVNGVATATTTSARPYWDAGQVLSTPGTTAYRSADEAASSPRKIYTLVDNDSLTGDGRFDANDHLIDFTVANVDAISPYLALDAAWCTSLYNRLGFAIPASWGTAEFRDCAKQVIWFVRGWDVLDEDEDGCAGPGGLGTTRVQVPKACTQDSDCSPSTANACSAGRCTCASGALGEERDEPNGHWKLGDIFHSSPQAVDPPFNEVLCDIGRAQTQCVSTLHSPSALTREVQTAIDRDGQDRDAYEQYRNATVAGVVNRDRTRVVLAGANDGMLHAFDGGGPDRGQAADAFGSYPYTTGTGAELWAFIPPDLLPKLKYALDGHQYFVDGNIMVRDIWQDANGDRVKQAGEFHTVAILSERSGGSQFVALDVTNALQPVFRWTFPQLCTTEQNLVGQSWTDFSPRPPPIGPVKIALPSGQRDALGRNFEERWVAMLNGGYDPAGTRGRGVWMVDAWSGDVLWRFADVDFQAMFPSGTPAGMYPVAASPGMVDIGDANQAILDSDGYFDTATWGDMGGQLWVARFKEPGVLVNGRVSNWFASRAFEELRRTDDNQVFWQLQPDGVTKQFRNEFYRMTSNIWEPNTATLRSFLGSGNRERLLTVGPTCGPTNFLGCAQSGCGVVKLTNTTQVGACTIVSKFLDNNNQFQHNSVTLSGCGTEPLDCSGGVKVRIDMNLNNCPGVQNPPDVSGTLTCGSDGTCSDRTKVGKTRDLSTKTWPALTNHNRFYGIWAYSSDRAFNSAATAVTFDQRRFTDVTYPAVCNGTAGNSCTLVNTSYATVSSSGAVTCTSGTTCSATSADGGWFYEYGRQCPLGNCTSTPPWTDEKTGSGATVIGSCVDWNTIRPMGAAVGGTPCTAGSGLPENYTYLADGITGVPDNRYCGFPSVANNLIYRATSRRSIAPPLDPTGVITVSSTGGVRQSALQIEPGTLSKKDLANKSDAMQPIYWLEVPRDLHACRHADGTLCK